MVKEGRDGRRMVHGGREGWKEGERERRGMEGGEEKEEGRLREGEGAGIIYYHSRSSPCIQYYTKTPHAQLTLCLEHISLTDFKYPLLGITTPFSPWMAST